VTTLFFGSAPARLLLALAVLVTGLLLATSSFAQGQNGVRVDYRAPDGCPDERAFVDAVRARTSRSFEATDTQDAAPSGPLWLVRITLGEAGASGDLVIRDASGSSTHRVVTARTCRDVAAALALVAGLAVEASPDASPVAIAVVAPAPASTEAPPQAASPTAPPLPMPRAFPRADPSPVFLELREHRGFRFGAGVGVDVLDFGSTGAVLAPSAVLEVAYESEGPLSPVLRVEALRSFETTVQAGADKAAFSWFLGRAQLCPVRARWKRRVTVLPCLAESAGTLSVAATGVASALTPTRPWFATDAEARVEWSVTHGFSLEVEGGAGVPALRDRFVFQPSPLVFQPSPVFGVGSFRAVLKIP
jgi:hypothetical protein